MALSAAEAGTYVPGGHVSTHTPFSDMGPTHGLSPEQSPGPAPLQPDAQWRSQGAQKRGEGGSSLESAANVLLGVVKVRVGQATTQSAPDRATLH